MGNDDDIVLNIKELLTEQEEDENDRIIEGKDQRDDEKKENDIKKDEIAYKLLAEQLEKRKEIKLKQIIEEKQNDEDEKKEKEEKLKQRIQETPTDESKLDINDLIKKDFD